MIEYANDNVPEEIWKTVPSTPELEASSHGRIRKKPYLKTWSNGATSLIESGPIFGCITSASKDARHLYFSTRYRSAGNIKVHAAVCEAFNGPNPDSRYGVRHLNENGLDNRPGNLMWAAQFVNLNDPVFKSYQRRRVSPKARTSMSKREKRAGIYDSIMDIGHYKNSLMAKKRMAVAANDNQSAADLFAA